MVALMFIIIIAFLAIFVGNHYIDYILINIICKKNTKIIC